MSTARSPKCPTARTPTSVPTPVMDAKTKAAVDRAFGDDLSAADKATLGTRHRRAARRDLGGGAVCPRIRLSHTATRMVDDKIRASLLTGIAVEQGKVALSDKGLFPEWTDGRKDITVENLLRMDSGIQWDETYDLGTPITRMLYLEPSMAGYVSSLPLAHPGGPCSSIRVARRTCCARCCRTVSDMPTMPPRGLPTGRVLFAPLGLSSAVLEPDGTGLPVCSSYLWATPRDWAPSVSSPCRTANGTETSCCRPTG